MKKIILLSTATILATTLFFKIGFATELEHSEKRTHHDMMDLMHDNRISLSLSSAQKQHQLANMRSHLEAVQKIVGLIAEKDYETAANIAHDKLGLTEEMQKMCNSIGTQEYKNLGLSFHKSGDELGEMLATRDLTGSLKALNSTMSYCIQCHATYRQ